MIYQNWYDLNRVRILGKLILEFESEIMSDFIWDDLLVIWMWTNKFIKRELDNLEETLSIKK